jgi:DNA polymerase-1
MSLLDVYNCDKRAALICRDMQIAGFAFDTERAKGLSASLLDAELDARARAEAAVGRPIRKTKSGGFGQKGPDGLTAAFFEDLGAPIYYWSSLTGAPSLGVDALKGYAACADPLLRQLAVAVLDWRRARKIRKTYIENIHVGADGRVHPTWKNYGAVSGRWACQGPNLMNLPRRENDPTWATYPGGVRSLYIPREGCVLVVFDAKQLEMRVAAYASGDEAMIAATSQQDLHAANARIVFAEFDTVEPHIRKALRTMAKSAGFAVCYLAEADTVHTRIVAAWDLPTPPPTMRQVDVMLKKMRRGFQTYYAWQEQRRLDCVAEGYTRTPILGRRVWLGHDPEGPKCANFPIQGGAADLMNLRLPLICDELAIKSPQTRIVAQVHDSGVFEVPRDDAELVSDICRKVFEQPIVISSSGRDIEAVFPIDVEVVERWS